jgi:hypothetical protein
VLSVPLRYTGSDFPLGIFKLFLKPKEEFEDTKGEIRTSISEKNRQHNGQKKSLKIPKG